MDGSPAFPASPATPSAAASTPQASTPPWGVPANAATYPHTPQSGTPLDDESAPVMGDADDWDEQVDRLLRRPENLRTVFQPIVDMRSGSCVGYEALTRVAEWPARSPQPWFQAASRSGRGAQLEAAALISALRGRIGLPRDRFLTVNLGSDALGDPAVSDQFLAQGDLHGLVVELTDIVAAIGEGRHTSVLHDLRRRGLAVAVDIAEGGLHELEQVTALAPDLVKLERGLVKGVHADPVRERVVRTATALADGIGAAVLAEGIETLEDARLLQFVGVRMGQGWLFGRARPGFLPPSAEVTAWLQATWEETAMLGRVGHLAVPTARLDDPQPVGRWLADLDPDGRLRRLHSKDGDVIESTELVRVRAGQEIRAAAGRVLSAGPHRRPFGIVAVIDDASRFVGIVDADVLFTEAVRVRGPLGDQPPGTEDPANAGRHPG